MVGRERLKPKWVQVHMVEKLLMRRKERLTVEQASNVNVKVRDELHRSLRRKPSGQQHKIHQARRATSIKMLSTKVISLPEDILESWNIAVLTAYGNIF